MACVISLEAPTAEGGSVTYRIDLSSGRGRATLRLAHDAFAAVEKCFTASAVPELEVAVDKLRGAN